MRKAHVLLVFVHQFVFIRVGMRPLVGLRISSVRMVAKEAVLLLAVDFLVKSILLFLFLRPVLSFVA